MNFRLFLIFSLVLVEIVDIKDFVFLGILQLIIGIEVLMVGRRSLQNGISNRSVYSRL
jgi:hypothetical protein